MIPPTTEREAQDALFPHLLLLPRWRNELGILAGLAGAGNEVDYRVSEPPLGRVWDDLRAELKATTLAVSRQPHGARVCVHDEAGSKLALLEDFDGLIATVPGAFVAVTVADCVPIYLGHRYGHAVGIVHAGWRGLAAGIVEAAILQMLEVIGGVPHDIVMHCGISICEACYEVGPEVWEALGKERPAVPTPLGLRAIAAERAAALGVESITISPICTAHDEGGLASHRKNAGSDRRMAAFVGIPP